MVDSKVPDSKELQEFYVYIYIYIHIRTHINDNSTLYFDVSWSFTATHMCSVLSVREEINSRGANS